MFVFLLKVKELRFIPSGGGGRKYQWIKIWGKMDNDIFFCLFYVYFYLLMFYCRWWVGTVFQTAVLVMALIPRLRPGLLSLRSVLSSRQLFLCSLAFGSLAMFKIYHG